MLQMLAWLGTCFLVIHAVPQVIKTYREQDATGLSASMLVFWWLGVTCTLPYVIQVGNWPVVAAHTVNFMACSILLGVKYKNKFRKK